MFFVQKWPFFQVFFLCNIGRENVLYDIVERKHPFLGSKKQEVQNVKKLNIFPTGLNHGFGPKMAIFPTFFFLAI